MCAPHRIILTPIERQESDIPLLSRAVKSSILEEIQEFVGNFDIQSLVARERFELSSEAPEAPILDH
jgi:hypothetical protein